MIGVNDMLDELLAAVIEAEACQESIAWVVALQARGLTVRELIAESRTIEEGEDWMGWVRLNLPDRLTSACRLAFSSAATVTDARLAAHLCVRGAHVSASEFQMLRSRWTDEQLPNFARAIREGVIRLVR